MATVLAVARAPGLEPGDSVRPGVGRG